MNRRDRRKWIVAALVVAVVSIEPVRAQPVDKPINAAQVLEAIERGIGYLKREQSPRGDWGEMAGYTGGVTALVTLSLLNAGVPADDPVVERALEYLRGLTLERTYVVSLQTMVFATAEPKKDMLLIDRNVRWLESKQVTEADRKGAWSYPGPGGDNSNSQFAVLALYDAQSVGAKVKRQTWQMAADYWRNTQNDDGSWGYVPGDAGSGSMTCAGIGALATSTAALESGDATVDGGRVVCCRPHQQDHALERAIDWLAHHFSVERNPRPAGSGQDCLYYYLYGLERAGRLTARRFIGDHDWYREGAQFLVNDQDPLSHYWKGSWHAEQQPPISTALALLFLAKGRRPVVMAKLEYGQPEHWNQHRRDAANLVAYTEKKWNLGLTWQTVDSEQATVEDLLQSPVLYVSGSRAISLLPYANKLRDYVDRGGFIFAEACCGDSHRFDESFRQLMAAVFPEPEYKLQQVTPGHPIWHMEEKVRPDSPYFGKLWSVEYGCRTSVIYSTEDLSCYWELAQPGRPTRYPEAVDQRIDDALAVGVNVLTYATNREPKGKEQSFELPTASLDPNKIGTRGFIEIAKLYHGGGCNDAPGALVNLVRAASGGELQLQVRAAPEMIGVGDANLFRYPLLFMHGRRDFRFTPAERTRLAEYLQRGGTLMSDAICASKPFTAAFRRELAATLPNNPIERIPPDDPLFTTAYGGYDIRHVMLRDPETTGTGQPTAARTRQAEPQLDGIRVGDRWAVIFSPFDISCALEEHEAFACRGYTREDAARIGLNVLLYSLNQ
jgi:Domain of unknown function (DUF4159)